MLLASIPQDSAGILPPDQSDASSLSFLVTFFAPFWSPEISIFLGNNSKLLAKYKPLFYFFNFTFIDFYFYIYVILFQPSLLK